MPRIETLVLFKVLHVAFTLSDFNKIDDIAIGVTRNHASVRCLRRHDERFNRRANQ